MSDFSESLTAQSKSTTVLTIMSTMTMTNNSDHHKYGDEASESLPNKRKYESEENEKDSSENSPSSTQKCHRRSIDDDDDVMTCVLI